MGDSEGGSFEESFKAFSRFGDAKSDGKAISLSQSDKWMKQAKVIDNKTITTTDTGIHFKKLKSVKVSQADYLKFLQELSKAKKVEVEDLKNKMAACKTPALSSTASTNPQGGKKVVDRLTDTSKYTGSHKERFDETGKGKGVAGRKELKDESGYVSGYTNKDTFDKDAPPTQ